MNTFVKLARQFALALTLVATLAGSGVVARAEAGGVGGVLPPPVMGVETLVAVTANYALYSQGSRLYANGVIVYSNGTVGRVPGR